MPKENSQGRTKEARRKPRENVNKIDENMKNVLRNIANKKNMLDYLE